MTNPPQQPGPYEPQDSFGQQNPGQQASPQGPPQNWAAAPGQFDNGQQGYSSTEPPKKKNGLIIGLVALGVLVIGGIVALIIILTSKDDSAPTAAGTPSASAPATTGAPSTGQSSTPKSTTTAPPALVGSATAAAASDAFIAAYNAGDNTKLASLHCQGVKPIQAPPRGAVLQASGPLQESGDTATITATSTRTSGPVTNGVLNFAKQTSGWCLTGIANG